MIGVYSFGFSGRCYEECILIWGMLLRRGFI